MLMIAMICMAVAAFILAVGGWFFKRSKTFSFLLRTLSLIALLCLGIVVANYKNNFSGYTIFLILSVAPQFLTIFDLSSYLNEKKEIVINKENSELASQVEDEPESDDKKPKRAKKHHFLNSKGSLLQSLALILSAVCIAFCGLYLGLETYFGLLIGLAIAFALMFLLLIIKKSINPIDLFGYFLMFLAIGLAIGQIATVLLYSYSLTNILFCAGALIYAVYVVLSATVNSRFDQMVYLISTFCLFATIIL